MSARMASAPGAALVAKDGSAAYFLGGSGEIEPEYRRVHWKAGEPMAVESDGAGSLAKALAAWSGGGPASAPGRWLERELDVEGLPRRLPVGDWAACLAALAEARR